MQTRNLGLSGLSVSALGLGCMGMSEFYGESNDAESLSTLEYAFEKGVTFYDSADTYGHGHNEELLSAFLRGRRDRVVVATKFGIFRSRDMGYSRRIDNSPDYIREACDASLRRLRTDVIDLYYVHRVNPDVPIEETVGTLAELVAAGKVRAIGLCEVSAATLRRAHAVHPVAAVQSEYSLWTRDPEDGVLPACRDLGVAFVAYSPLGRGFLTGTIRDAGTLSPEDFRRANPRFQDANLEANLARLELVRAIAQERRCTPGQIALAWLLAQGEDIVPIPGTRRRKYLDENCGAAEVRLTATDMERLEAAFPPGATAGERYPAEGMKGINA
ncbi:aldo/keto reductase [Arenibaculum sp.]|uniref:aldo/keto reductase n=1 Tax=Arenibaculum sp. TaxID=2865862 RepID=UPI002E111A5E|nr:aldo/keto reductase [Arenibaculum sp.]